MIYEQSPSEIELEGLMYVSATQVEGHVLHFIIIMDITLTSLSPPQLITYIKTIVSYFNISEFSCLNTQMFVHLDKVNT